MFDLFSESARQVIVFARGAVSEIGGQEIDSDFLLWGLAREAEPLLQKAGAPGLCEAIERERATADKPSQDSDLPLGRDAHAALVQATQEAKRMGSRQVEPAHLLLGLLADRQSPAGARLAGLGIVAEQVRALAREQPNQG